MLRGMGWKEGQGIGLTNKTYKQFNLSQLTTISLFSAFLLLEWEDLTESLNLAEERTNWVVIFL